MPRVISAPRTKLPARPTHRSGERSPSVSPPAGKSPRLVIAKNAAAASSARPMPIWTRRRGQPATTPAPSHAPATEAAIIARERRHLDLDDRDEDEGLRDRRHRVADVERARDQLVGHEPLELEDRRRRREGADAERVEEVRHEADQREQRGGARPTRAEDAGAEPDRDEDQRATTPSARRAPASASTRWRILAHSVRIRSP